MMPERYFQGNDCMELTTVYMSEIQINSRVSDDSYKGTSDVPLKRQDKEQHT